MKKVVGLVGIILIIAIVFWYRKTNPPLAPLESSQANINHKIAPGIETAFEVEKRQKINVFFGLNMSEREIAACRAGIAEAGVNLKGQVVEPDAIVNARDVTKETVLKLARLACVNTIEDAKEPQFDPENSALEE